MFIQTNALLDTTMSKAENSYDTETQDNLEDFLNDKLVQVPEIKIVAHTKDFGDIAFRIFFNKYDIIKTGFKCNITVKGILDLDYDPDIVYDKLIKDVKFIQCLTNEVYHFINQANEFLKGEIYIPIKESFKFIDERFWIEMDPYESYTPEFDIFEIYTDINSDDFIDNFYVI